jgi:hypothetical protein
MFGGINMPRYHILFHVTGALIPREDNGKHLSGFYVNRWINAETEAAAKRSGSERLKNEKNFRQAETLSMANGGPRLQIEIEGIEKVSWFSQLVSIQQGYIFYPEENDDRSIEPIASPNSSRSCWTRE